MENQGPNEPTQPKPPEQPPSQQPIGLTSLNTNQIYPDFKKPATNPQHVSDTKINAGPNIKKRPPIGVIIIGVIGATSALLELVGPADIFVLKNGHFVLKQVFFPVFQLIFVYHRWTASLFFYNLIFPILGLLLSVYLLKLSEIARLITVVLSAFPLLGLSLAVVMLLRGAHYDSTLTTFIFVAWAAIVAEVIYLTRPAVKARFR